MSSAVYHKSGDRTPVNWVVFGCMLRLIPYPRLEKANKRKGEPGKKPSVHMDRREGDSPKKKSVPYGTLLSYSFR